MKDLVKAADGSVEGLKQLLKQEWELPEDTRVAVYVLQLYLVAVHHVGLACVIYVHNSNTCVLKPCRYGVDCDGAEFEFTPMVAHDLTGTLAGAQAVLLRVMPLQHVVSAHTHVPSLSTSE